MSESKKDLFDDPIKFAAAKEMWDNLPPADFSNSIPWHGTGGVLDLNDLDDEPLADLATGPDKEWCPGLKEAAKNLLEKRKAT